MDRTCPECGEVFTARRKDGRFCSPLCLARAMRDNPSRQCEDPGCARPVRARGLCQMHLRRVYRAEGSEAPPVWNERRKANKRKRDALKWGVDAESIVDTEVYDRDGWLCGICAAPVDRSLVWPDPQSVSLDHVVPLSRGGAHVLSNVQCSHLRCNIRKGVAA